MIGFTGYIPNMNTFVSLFTGYIPNMNTFVKKLKTCKLNVRVILLFIV